jgi:hypothetical protein
MNLCWFGGLQCAAVDSLGRGCRVAALAGERDGLDGCEVQAAPVGPGLCGALGNRRGQGADGVRRLNGHATGDVPVVGQRLDAEGV